MLCQQDESLLRDTELQVSNFLHAIFSNQYPNQDKHALLESNLSTQIQCIGFPEFNPQSLLEFSGFLNYLHDVFKYSNYAIEPLMFDEQSALLRFTIQGVHHEEFMGLAASGGVIKFTAIAHFKMCNNRITEILMHNKALVLTTTKGHVYQLKSMDIG